MDLVRRWQFTAATAAVVLAVPLAATSWKMLEFRGRLHDFIDNSRWEHSVTAIAKDRPVLLFGDSEIALWPMGPSFGALNAVNRGISGDWATKAVSRFEREFEALRPRTTVLLIGTNDIANGITDEEIIGAIRAMLHRARGGRTILCGLLPSSGEEARLRPADRILSLNMKLEALAQEFEAEYVDLHSVLRDELNGFDRAYTIDGLHPSPQGYLRMTQTLLPVLLQKRTDATCVFAPFRP